MSVNITLYASLESPTTIFEKIMEQKQDRYIVEFGEETLQIFKKGLFKKKLIGQFTHRTRQQEDANQFTQGLIGYIHQEIHGDEAIKQKLLIQGEHTNVMLGCMIEEDEAEAFFPSYFQFIQQLNGFIYVPSGDIISVDGQEIANGEGQIIAEDFTVQVAKRELKPLFDVTETVENQGRRVASIAKIKARHIPYTENLSLLPDSKQVRMRSVEEIARRAVVVLILIQFVRELLDEKEKTNLKTSKRIAEVFLNRYGVKMNLTAEEEAFLAQEDYTQQELINKMWLYEAVWVMLWSIHLVEELVEPTQICDVEHTLNLLMNYTNIGELLQDAEARDVTEVLNRMDENYLYHWACTEARLQGKESPADLDDGVVLERQRAFNWMTQLHEEQWDDVTVYS